MNWKQPLYFGYAAMRGYRFPALLRQYWREYEQGVSERTVTAALRQLLDHCRRAVPYYAELLARTGDEARHKPEDPRAELRRLPILTKDLVRAHFARLQSKDQAGRNWYYNSSGGSTGEPIRLIQDTAYSDCIAAMSLFYQRRLGCELGQPVVRLWGSETEVTGQRGSWKARFFNWLTGTTLLNAFRMSEERMREFLLTLNRLRPRLIVAYAQAAYELARFAERERLPIQPQHALVTSAGTLYPFMREKLGQVFGCPVYNLYGSREVGDIACELPGIQGLWVAPWGSFVEIVDEAGQPVAPGTEGNILVTCLTNYAMPLLRYWIGDRGALLPQPPSAGRPVGLESSSSSKANEGSKRGSERSAIVECQGLGSRIQVLHHVSGRNVDVFRTRDQTLVDGEYFTHLLYQRPWVWKFQVVQKNYDQVVFKIVAVNGKPDQAELEGIAAQARRAMGAECRVEFEFPPELPPHPSGKYRYTISEL